MHFQTDDTVRVVRLLDPEREVTGSSDPAPQPRVGDRAKIVAELGEGLYLLESCTDDGMTLSNGKPPVRGRDAVRQGYEGSGGPLALRAIAYATWVTVS